MKSIMKHLFNNLYQLIPGKKYLFLLIKMFYKPPLKIAHKLYFGGSFPVNYKSYSFRMNGFNKRGFSRENLLFWYGLGKGANWERQSVDLWIEMVKYSEVVLDIGANTGFYSLLAKSVNPNIKVIGFEPVAHVYNYYSSNCKLNKYDIDIHNIAISNNTGYSQIFSEKTEKNVYSASLDEKFAKDHSTKEILAFQIKTVTLFDFIKQEKLSKVDLIKIDVEGFEAEVLVGMGEYLRNFAPTMLIEILTDELGAEVQSILDDVGYLYFKLNKGPRPELVQKIIASDDYNYFICKVEVAKQLKLL